MWPSRTLPSDARLAGQTAQRLHRQAHFRLRRDDLMGIRISNLAVLLLSLGVGALAVYLENVAVAAICFSIAAFYAALTLWLWRRRKKKE